MMNVKRLLVLLVFVSFFGCLDTESELDNPDVEMPQVITLEFMADDNESLEEDILATIDHIAQEIEVVFPPHTSLKALTPSLLISNGADIEPNSQIQQDFSKPVVYTLSGDGFEEVNYTVIATVIDSDEAVIHSLDFLISDNPNLEANIPSTIEGHVIKLQISSAIDISELVATIIISEGASISPDSSSPLDFTNEVKYTVTAQNTVTKSEYTVQVTRSSSDNSVTAFLFDINEETYSASIDNNTFEISLELPYSTDLSSLSPIVEVGEGAGVVPESGVTKDFNDVVTYEVTAEDGTLQVYTVDITTLTALGNDRAVLEALYNANKDFNTSFTYLDWDLEAESMDDWTGVTMSDGRVTELMVSSVYIQELPKRIGELSELESLTIVGTELSELPIQIGDLEKLEKLSLWDNALSSLPHEIGNLVSMRNIYLQDNLIDSLPIEIGLLDKLTLLRVENNNLNQIPVELAQLPVLLVLNVENNPLTVIPQEICDMTTDLGLAIVITKDLEDTCE